MQDVKDSGKLEKPAPMTATNTFQQLRAASAARSSGSAKAPMNTSGGRHPGVSRISKHPMTSLTSRKSQQGKGAC